jgi:hypothetical protein
VSPTTVITRLNVDSLDPRLSFVSSVPPLADLLMGVSA